MTGRLQTRPAARGYVKAASLADVRAAGCKVVHVDGHTIALFARGEKVHAVDNRCPHMGFPLSKGTISDCILTCHWHHARFDLSSGGTFDPWADDVRVFRVDLRGDEVWVDVTWAGDSTTHQHDRVRDGLQRNIPLVLAKAVIKLTDDSDDPAALLRAGLDFGSRYRWEGWGQGLTILTCMSNLLGYLAEEDRPRALYQGLAAVAMECHGQPPRFELRPLPETTADAATLKVWFRQFVEVRDADGAERCIITALRLGADSAQMADMIFAAATDHRYIQTGHVLDFANKAFEALDAAGWECAAGALGSLAHGLATAQRMEESNTWRHPVDLVSILNSAFQRLGPITDPASAAGGPRPSPEELLIVLHGDDPEAIAETLLEALGAGWTPQALAGTVAYAAALRIARFHTSNEFADWDTALHTFSFANAVHQGMRRAPSVELLRGVFDAAMSVYLDRFLNVPAARVPQGSERCGEPEQLLTSLRPLLDQQQQVNEAGETVAGYLAAGGDPQRLLAMLGTLLLREDRDFHTIQTVEAAMRQYGSLRSTPRGPHVLIAAARYLAAHSPTVRAQGQTFQIAQRLHRGERIYEDR
ncbi:MAG: Rieske (2Fe-2S) protein [Planctomycetes bacterium]|nr:Rieske (2Fe-2S) protein [Planctomycetota bacterium]